MLARFNLRVFTLLLVGFIDHVGLGLVYPLFAALLFDPHVQMLAPDCSLGLRGMLFGLLIGLTPLTQFFSSPILGALSDSKGRKVVLIFGITAGFIGYIAAVVGIWMQSIWLLFLCRLLVGISDGTVAVAQAALVDIGTEETKVRYFSLFNMALGAGFTMGPFLGGKLSDPTLASWCGYMTPFIFAGVMCLINLVLVLFKLENTKPAGKPLSFSVLDSLDNLRKAFSWKGLRFLFLASFAFTFGWTFFIEFVPLFLRDHFDFSSSETGNFFAYMGLWYALSTGLLTTPIINRFSSRQIAYFSLLILSIYLPVFLLIEDPLQIWGYLPLVLFLLALIYPSVAALVSDRAGDEEQGKILGVYHSVNAFAVGISPLCAGSIVAAYPSLTVWVGAFMMLMASGIFAAAPYLEKKQPTYV